MYSQMKAIASNPDINIFTLSDELYEWMDINKVAIKNDIRQDFSCGCDKTTDVFLNTSNAARECTSICGDLGWNGQWTSARPYVPDTANGSCGCNSIVKKIMDNISKELKVNRRQPMIMMLCETTLRYSAKLASSYSIINSSQLCTVTSFFQ